MNRIVYLLFSRAPNIAIILQLLSKSVSPMSWSISLAELLSKRAEILKDLFEYENVEIRTWAREQHMNLLKKADREREAEESRDRSFNERFE